MALSTDQPGNKYIDYLPSFFIRDDVGFEVPLAAADGCTGANDAGGSGAGAASGPLRSTPGVGATDFGVPD